MTLALQQQGKMLTDFMHTQQTIVETVASVTSGVSPEPPISYTVNNDGAEWEETALALVRLLLMDKHSFGGGARDPPMIFLDQFEQY
ncbi:hypothetical protein FQR65_LT01359 [Abscondita terminalis]|nr:hypothetical protein FQR65_LT01359 [Abscondita terminalis]